MLGTAHQPTDDALGEGEGAELRIAAVLPTQDMRSTCARLPHRLRRRNRFEISSRTGLASFAILFATKCGSPVCCANLQNVVAC